MPAPALAAPGRARPPAAPGPARGAQSGTIQPFVLEALVTVAAMAWGYDMLKQHLLGADRPAYRFTIISWYGNASAFGDSIRQASQAQDSFDSVFMGGLTLGMGLFMGHVSIELKELGTPNIQVKGLWPTGVRNDAAYAGGTPSRETYYIDAAHGLAVAAAIAADEAVAPRFSWLGRGGGYSCASWAVRMARIAGVSAGTVVDRYLVSIPKLMAFAGT